MAVAMPLNMQEKITFEQLIEVSRKTESRDPAEDYGLFPIDSLHGKTLIKVADRFQKEAESAEKKGNNRDALVLYREALLRAMQVRSNCIQQSLLLCGRTRICYVENLFEAALRNALAAVNCWPNCPEALLLAGSALESFGRLADAFNIVSRVLDIVHNALTYRLIVKCITFCLKIGPKVRTCDTHISQTPKTGLDVVCEANIATKTWEDVVKALAEDESWEILGLLLSKENVKDHIKCLDTSHVTLSKVIFASVSAWNEWGEQLVLLFLENGADLKTICPKSTYPFHIALKLGLKTDKYNLLEKLLKHHRQAVSSVDDKGDSLLHVACRCDSQQTRTAAISLLLEYKIDASMANTAGKLAHELIPAKHPDWELITKYLTAQSNRNPELHPRSTTLKHNSPDCHVNITENHETSHHKASETEVTIPRMLPSASGTRLLCRDWSAEYVQLWFKKVGFENYQKFLSFDGILLEELYWMQQKAPKYFSRHVLTNLNLSLPELLFLSRSLRTLQ